MEDIRPAQPHVLNLLEIALSAACAASVRAAVELGLPEALGDRPAPADELALAVGADPDALRRLLRSLTGYGVFAENANGYFTHTTTSRMLQENAPDSLKHLVLWCTEPWMWNLWGKLAESVRTGKDEFAGLYGSPFFEQLHTAWPASAGTFDLGMTESSKVSAVAIADMLPMLGVRTVVDVAGGQGLTLATILERYPSVQGTLLELPEVVADADERLQNGGALAGRAELLAGDCRVEIPIQADIYFFKNILGMGDVDAVQTMRNAAKAGRPGVKIVVVENFVDDGPGQRFSTAMDLRMLLTVGGRKHTKTGLLDLIETAGLKVQSVRPIDSYQHMIEATVPA